MSQRRKVIQLDDPSSSAGGPSGEIRPTSVEETTVPSGPGSEKSKNNALIGLIGKLFWSADVNYDFFKR